MTQFSFKALADTSSVLLLVTALQVATVSFAADDPVGIGNEDPLFRAEQMFRSGSFVASIDVFKMADGLNRNEGVVGASRSYAMIGRYDEAIAVCEELIDGDDYVDFPLVATQLAEVKRMIGQSAQALEIFAAVVDEDLQGAPVRTLVQ